MEVTLPPDLEAKLAHLAFSQGQKTEALVVEAVERMVHHDEWFAAEVEKGMADIEAGNVLSHEEAGIRLERRLSTRRTA